MYRTGSCDLEWVEDPGALRRSARRISALFRALAKNASISRLMLFAPTRCPIPTQIFMTEAFLNY